MSDWEDKLHLETVVTALNYTDSMVVVTTDKGTFTGMVFPQTCYHLIKITKGLK